MARKKKALPDLLAIDEATFQAQVLQLATLCGWVPYHTYDSRHSEEGFPDLALRHPLRKWLCVAELKVGDNVPTPAQAEWLQAFAQAGVRAFIWTPDDWDLIKKVLRDGP